MFNEFVLWLLGIEEDDPIPYEVKHIYFYVNGKEIGFGGRENFCQEIKDFEYYPIESQYFPYSTVVVKYNFSMTDFKLLLGEVFENEEIKKIYENKIMHIGYLYKSVVYSFEVEKNGWLLHFFLLEFKYIYLQRKDYGNFKRSKAD